MLFGVLDGHGGNQVSRFVAKFFLQVMKRLTSYKQEKYDQALIETYIKMDELLKIDKINNLLKFNEIESLTQQSILEVILAIENSSNSSSFDKGSSFEKSCRSDSPIKDNSTCKEQRISNITYYNNWEIEADLTKDLNSKKRTRVNSQDDPVVKDIKVFEYDNVNSGNNQKEEKQISLDSLVAHNMGTTAIIVYIRNKVLYIANVGDSRAVLYKGGKAIRLNQEHKPSLVSEQSRIKKSGFHLISNRIDGKLNLTRANGNDKRNIR